MLKQVSKFLAVSSVVIGVAHIAASQGLGANAETENGTRLSAVSPESVLAAAAIRVPHGFSVAPVASEPQLANPVAFCFDPQGRIYVAENHRQHDGFDDNREQMEYLDDDLAARTVADRRDYILRRLGDSVEKYTKDSDLVRRLEDRDGDGQYEHSTVFSTGYGNVEEGTAAGVLWDGDRLLFTCIPSLWELRDADGDGRAEHKQALLSGFGVHVAFFGHDLHGLIHGPDGKIYFSIGDRGLHVETADGRVISNPDSGAVLRCDPDGGNLEVFATGFRNPQELAFNEYGDLFTVDNNSDGGDQARLVHVVEGMDAGWRMSYQYFPDRGPFHREKIWHLQNDEQPASIVPPLAHITSGPSGLVHYPGTGLPREHDGAFFVCDFTGTVGTSGVREFWVEPQGATYRLSKEKMFAKGVLTTDCDFGPDGALYILDWIEGWNGAGKGRVHRVLSDDESTVEQRRATSTLLKRLPEADEAGLLAHLGHDDMRVRLAAQRRLVSAGVASSTELVRVAASPNEALLARLHAIWAIGELSEEDSTLLEELARLMDDKQPEIRAQVARTLGRAVTGPESLRQSLGDSLVPLLADASPRVRALTAISLGKLGHRESLAALLKMSSDAGDDPVQRHAAAVGLSGSQEPEKLVAAAREGNEPARLTIAVALRRQKSPLVAELLRDEKERVRTEAARAIWDNPIPAAYPQLAATLEGVAIRNEPMFRRVLAANVALGETSHLKAVIQRGLREDAGGHEQLWQIVRDWATPISRDPVHGSWRPASARSRNDVIATVKSMVPDMVEAGVPGEVALVVAAELRVAAAYQPLIHVVTSRSLNPQLSARAYAALEYADENTIEQAIEKGLTSKEPTVRTAARRLMLKRFPNRAIDALREATYSASTAERQAALLMLADESLPEAQAAIAHWMNRVEQGDCPPELQLDVLQAASQSKDESLAVRSRRYTELALERDPLSQFSGSLYGGDAQRGRQMFEEDSALSCGRCHSFQSGEKRVGPNLADVGSKLSREDLLESIVKPNAKIAEGFQTTVLQLDTGKVVSGILRSENAKRVVLIDPDGKAHAVKPSAIEERFEGTSAMPEDIVKFISPREMRDLVEFLSGLRHPGDHAGESPAVSRP